MSQKFQGHFDGTAIIPDEPVNLPPGRRVRVHIEPIEDESYPLTQIGELATDMGVTDLAERHRDYARKGPASR